MSESATTPICRRCGAFLSRYRCGEEDLCAPCARTLAEEERVCILDQEAMLFAVAGVLFTCRATKPECRVHLRDELAGMGIAADHVDLFQAVQKLRRRGLKIEADERRPGYRLISWSHRFRRRFRGRRHTRREQLSLFDQADQTARSEA